MPFLAPLAIGIGGSLLGKLKKKKSQPAAGGEDQVGRLARLGASGEAQRNSLFSTLEPGYKGMLDSGYSPEEQSAIEQGSLGTVGGTFDSARDRLANHLARTRNAAGYGSTMSELTREEGRQKGAVTQSNKIAFADEKQRRKMAGLQGLAGLYGIDTSFLSNVLGQATGIQAIRENKKLKAGDILGFLSQIAARAAQGAAGAHT